MPNKRFKTSITLDWKLLDQVKVEAKKHRRSVSQLIEMAIEDWLAAVSEEDQSPK
jgi:hypothetical protein